MGHNSDCHYTVAVLEENERIVGVVHEDGKDL
jgi:hypothetical protein